MITRNQRDRRLFGVAIGALVLMVISFIIGDGLSLISNNNAYDCAISFGAVMFVIMVLVSLAYLIAALVKCVVFCAWVVYIWMLMAVKGDDVIRRHA